MGGYDQRFRQLPTPHGTDVNHWNGTTVHYGDRRSQRTGVIKANATHSFRTRPTGNSLDGFQRRASDSYADRLKFYKAFAKDNEDSDRAFTGTDSAGKRIPGFFTSDVGHSFASVKLHALPVSFEGRVHIGGRQTPLLVSEKRSGIDANLSYGGSPLAQAYLRQHGMRSPLQWMQTGNPFQLRTQFPMDEATRMFSSLAPRSSGLGETLIEFASLNLPQLLAKLSKLIAKKVTSPNRRIRKDSKEGRTLLARVKRIWGDEIPVWLSATGSDYVGIRFGVEPVIMVILDILDIVSGTEETLYGQSFRRHRQMSLRTQVYDRPFGGFYGLDGYSPPPRKRRERLQNLLDWSGGGSGLDESSAAILRHFEQVSSSWGWSLEQLLDYMDAASSRRPTGPPVPRSLPGGRTSFVPRTIGAQSAPPLRSEVFVSEDVRLVSRSTRAGRTPLSEYYQANNMIRRLGLWTPTLGWDLLPYSWFVDWFAGVSTRLKNNQFFELYPVDYAYATYQSQVTVQSRALESWSNSGGRMSHGKYSYGLGTVTSTVRLPVDPFGSGLRPPGLTLDSYRTAILVGLGLGKLR